MSSFNGFGLTYTDIIRSFNGAIESDFATDNATGQQVIEREIALQEAELVQSLDPAVLRLMDRLEGIQVDWKIDTLDITWLPSIPPIVDSFSMYLDVESFYRNARGCGVNEPINCNYNIEDLQLFTDYTIEQTGYGVTTVIAGPSVNPDYKYYAVYDVDTSLLSLDSLANTLRNKVCCILGHQLYSRQDSSWKLVDKYCELGERSLKGYIPPEFKRLKWFKYPFNVGIVSQRWVRG